MVVHLPESSIELLPLGPIRQHVHAHTGKTGQDRIPLVPIQPRQRKISTTRESLAERTGRRRRHMGHQSSKQRSKIRTRPTRTIRPTRRNRTPLATQTGLQDHLRRQITDCHEEEAGPQDPVIADNWLFSTDLVFDPVFLELAVESSDSATTSFALIERTYARVGAHFIKSRNSCSSY